MMNDVHRATVARVRPRYVLALALLLGLLIQGCSSDTSKLTVGKQAPDFTLPEAMGGTVSLADYVGEQPVLLFFHMAVG